MSKIIDQKLASALHSIGISEKEGEVYAALLQNGERGAIWLSKHLSMHRQFVYNALRALKEKGLVFSLGDRGSKWQALSPHKLISIAEDQQRDAEFASEQLQALVTKSAGQEFDVIVGRAAFRKRQMDIIRNLPPDITLHMICGQWERFYEEIGERDYEEYERLRAKKNIRIRFVGPREKMPDLQEASEKRFSNEYRYVSGLETGLVNTIIYEDMVEFEIYGEPHVTFSIRNKEVAESQRLFFESLWKSGVQ